MLNDLNYTIMKKMLFTLVTMLTIAVSANAMSYEQARREALFLTDKMAYELNLTDAQYEAAYEINLDYLMGVTSYNDVFGTYWERRNLDLSYILYTWQWDLFRAATYFYRPLYWEAGYWHFGIYARYPHRDYFYFGQPHFYVTYRGGHSWRHNGGRSYYEGHHSHYRPDVHRDHHMGMRNSWDRGDYRGNHGRSSTRVTGDDRDSRRGREGGVRDNNGRSNNRNNDRSVNHDGSDRNRNGGTVNSGRAIERTNTNRNIERRDAGRSIERSNSNVTIDRSSSVSNRSSNPSISNRSVNSGSVSSRSANSGVSSRSGGSFSGGGPRSSGSISRSSGGSVSRSGGNAGGGRSSSSRSGGGRR